MPRQDLALAIQSTLLNDCPNPHQEALLAVAWAEPAILRSQLEDHAEALLLHGEQAMSVDLLQVGLSLPDCYLIAT